MQTGERDVSSRGFFDSKTKLLALISGIVIGVLVPVVLPHLTHPSMIYHITVHIASIIIALFLTAVSVVAYGRTASGRMLFMTLAFLSLAAVEVFYLFVTIGVVELIIIPDVNIELPHLMLLAMLVLFGTGVLKVNRK